MPRVKVEQEHIERADREISKDLERRLKEKGDHSFASTHEILGILTEEVKELTDAVQANNMEWFMKELKDIAVACHFGVASHKADGLDW